MLVDDVPKHLDHAGRSSHSIYISSKKLRIPLSLTGIISGFASWKPESIEECQKYPQIEMTSPVEWVPSSSSFAEKEELCVSSLLCKQ